MVEARLIFVPCELNDGVGAGLQCWRMTAEGPSGPDCAGECEIRGVLCRISRLVTAVPVPQIPLILGKQMALRLPTLVQQSPAVPINS